MMKPQEKTETVINRSIVLQRAGEFLRTSVPSTRSGLKSMMDDQRRRLTLQIEQLEHELKIADAVEEAVARMAGFDND
jgi:hypothetical protein